jgi:hypothetical protein
MFMSTFEWATTIGKFNQLILVIFILTAVVVQRYSRVGPSNQFLHKLDSEDIATTDVQPASATPVVDNCTSGSGQATVVAGKPAHRGHELSFQADSPPMYFLRKPNGRVTTVLARQPAKTRLRKKSDGSFYVQILSIPSDRRAIRDKKIEASMRRGVGEDVRYSKSNRQQKAIELERQSVILVREIEDANTSDQEVTTPSTVLVHVHHKSRVWQIFCGVIILACLAATLDAYKVQVYEVPTAVPSVSSAPAVFSAPTAYDHVAEIAIQCVGSYVESDGLEIFQGSGIDLWGPSDSFYSHTSQSTAPCNFSAKMCAAEFQMTAWPRFVKKMEKIEFYTTIDEPGEAWTLHATNTIFFPDDQCREGLAPTPQSTDHLAEATFNGYEVQIYEVPTVASAVSSVPTISSVSTACAPTAYNHVTETAIVLVGLHAESDGLESLQGSGIDIWGTSDSFYFHRNQLDAARYFSAEMCAATFNNGQMNSRGGIMLRNSLAPDAANAFVGAEGQWEVAVSQSRAAAGARTVHHQMIWTNWANAFYIRLNKADTVATASFKVDEAEEWFLFDFAHLHAHLHNHNLEEWEVGLALPTPAAALTADAAGTPADATDLMELERELAVNYRAGIEACHALFHAVHDYQRELNRFMADLAQGFYIGYTVESVLLDADGLALLCEAVWLCGVMLILMERRLSGPFRERLVIAHFRLYGRDRDPARFNRISTLCRSVAATPFTPSPRSRRSRRRSRSPRTSPLWPRRSSSPSARCRPTSSAASSAASPPTTSTAAPRPSPTSSTAPRAWRARPPCSTSSSSSTRARSATRRSACARSRTSTSTTTGSCTSTPGPRPTSPRSGPASRPPGARPPARGQLRGQRRARGVPAAPDLAA